MYFFKGGELNWQLCFLAIHHEEIHVGATFTNSRSYKAFRAFWPTHNRPLERLIRDIMYRFRNTFILNQGSPNYGPPVSSI